MFYQVEIKDKRKLINERNNQCLTLKYFMFCSWQPVIDFIDNKYDEFLNAESRVNRITMPDTRVHTCLYFIAPTGHG